jgi:uncharacterized protein (TIGR02996 family)
VSVTVTRAELLRLIDENPDEVDRWLLLADFLQQEDAPRGELIALDVALETATEPQRGELAARRAELVAARAPAILGETFCKVIAEGYGSVGWRRGFVDEVRYVGVGLRHHRAVGWLVKLMADESEPFAFMRKLDLAATDLASLAPLVRFTHLAELNISGTKVTDLAPLASLARLRALDIRGCAIARSAVAELKLRGGIAVRQ